MFTYENLRKNAKIKGHSIINQYLQNLIDIYEDNKMSAYEANQELLFFIELLENEIKDRYKK
jgi:hypothetical protein